MENKNFQVIDSGNSVTILTSSYVKRFLQQKLSFLKPWTACENFLDSNHMLEIMGTVYVHVHVGKRSIKQARVVWWKEADDL